MCASTCLHTTHFCTCAWMLFRGWISLWWEGAMKIVVCNNKNNNGNFYSALPIKNCTAQGAYKSDTNNITDTYTHAQTHRSSFQNYMPPKYTYQKAENQTTGPSFALSLSLSPPTRSHTGAGHMQFYRRKSRVTN